MPVVQVYPQRDVSNPDAGYDQPKAAVPGIVQDTPEDLARKQLLGDLQMRLSEVPIEVLKGGYFGFCRAGYEDLARTIAGLGGKSFEKNLAGVLKYKREDNS